MTFTMTPAGGSGGPYKYLVNAIYLKQNGVYLPEVDPTRFEYVESNQFTFTFMAPGDYYIDTYVMDFNGGEYPTAGKPATKPITISNRNRIYFTIEDNNPAYPSLDTVIKNIVDECNSHNYTTDYEKALFFHDWIIDHSTYDNSYVHISETGVLIRGTGTCESYYRAFEVLLKQVGIPCERAVGNGHVWNCVKLDGEWTQIDPTWDGGGYSGDLAYMRHLYFGITDEFTKKVHSEHKPVSSRPCKSYQNNYFLNSGEITRWTDPLKTKILAEMAAGKSSFTIEPDYSLYPNVYNIIYPLAAYYLSGLPETEWHSHAVSVAFTDAKKFSVTVTHSWDGGVAVKEATCQETGLKSYTCTHCAETRTETIPKTSHTWNKTSFRAATCTADGSETYTCVKCGAGKTGSIPKTAHKPGAWSLLGGAGVKVQRCSACSAELSRQSVSVSLNAASLPLQVKKSTSVLGIQFHDPLDSVSGWTSSNPGIVTVNPSTGTIKAGKKKGSAYVTVVMQSGASASCLIKVQTKKVTASQVSVNPAGLTLWPGQTWQLNTTVYPLTASQKASYKSSNKKVVSVSSRGFIKAKKAGTATITVKSGKKRKKVKVIVR